MLSGTRTRTTEPSSQRCNRHYKSSHPGKEVRLQKCATVHPTHWMLGYTSLHPVHTHTHTHTHTAQHSTSEGQAHLGLTYQLTTSLSTNEQQFAISHKTASSVSARNKLAHQNRYFCKMLLNQKELKLNLTFRWPAHRDKFLYKKKNQLDALVLWQHVVCESYAV